MTDILRLAILAFVFMACTSDEKRSAETAQWVGPLVDSIAAKASSQGIPATGPVMIDAGSFAHALRDIAPGIDAKQIDEFVSDSVQRTTAEQSVECAGASCGVRGQGVYIHMDSVRAVKRGHRVFLTVLVTDYGLDSGTTQPCPKLWDWFVTKEQAGWLVKRGELETMC